MYVCVINHPQGLVIVGDSERITGSIGDLVLCKSSLPQFGEYLRSSGQPEVRQQSVRTRDKRKTETTTTPTTILTSFDRGSSGDSETGTTIRSRNVFGVSIRRKLEEFLISVRVSNKGFIPH